MVRASDTEPRNPLEFPGDRNIFCFNEVTLVGSWVRAGRQKDQAMIGSLQLSAHHCLLILQRGERGYKGVNNQSWGFPGGTVVENLPANAGDMGSSPVLGRSHMPRSNWDREPQLLSLRIWSLRSATREAAIVRGPRTTMKSGPRSPQLEKALTGNEDPTQQK